MPDPIVINLFERPIEDGEFRIKNLPGETFRPHLVDRGNQLSVKIDIVGITHGEILESGDLATVLIFESRFVATGGRRFRRASVAFKFEDSEGHTTRDPVVHAISPEGQWALNKTQKVQNFKYGANASITAGTAMAGAEVGLLWEVEEVRSRQFYTTLTGVKKIIRRGFLGGENVVIWKMEENEEKNDGIPTLLRTAILLRRSDDVPFTFTVKVESDVDFVGEVKTLFGLEKKDPIDPVEIDPEGIPKAARTMVKTLDPKYHNLKAMDRWNLKEVADVAVVTVLDGADLLKGGSST